jgi:hypothetical protein
MENTSDRVVARYQPGAIVGFSVEDFLRGKHGVPNPMRPPKAYPERPSQPQNPSEHPTSEKGP